MQTHERWIVGRCRDNYGFLEIFFAEDVFDEFAYFSAALADQANHDHIGFSVTGHLAKQHALADAAAGEQTNTLATAHGEQCINGAHTNIKRVLIGWRANGLMGAPIMR